MPAFVVSPFIPKGQDGRVNVSKTVYDHTTIPATILRRFCSPHVPSMGARLDNAADLRELLTLDASRPSSEFTDLLVELANVQGLPSVTPEGVIAPPPLHKPRPDPTKPDDHEHLEDFHGFMAYAASVTGLGRR